MPKMSGCRLVLLLSVLVACSASSSFCAEGGSRQLVSPRLLKHAGLKISWENELPIKKDEHLAKLFLLGERIYAISDRNYVIASDIENGNIVFSRSLGPEGIPLDRLTLYGDELVVVLGSTLIEANAQSGTERKTTQMKFGIACPAGRNSSFLYLGGVDRRLHVLQAKDRVQVFEAAAENNSAITSIIAGEDFIIFATDAGNVISIVPDRPTRLWQFDAGDAVVGSLVRDGSSIFLASKDTNVYRVDIDGPTRRRLAWKYQMPAALEAGPQVTAQVVYQYARGKGLTAIDKEKGSTIWMLPEGIELLSEAEGKAYVITKDRTLAIMDNVEAKKIYSVNFAQVSRYAANAADAKIYIGDESGRIACLEPANRGSR